MKKNYQLSIANYQLYKDSGVEWLGEVPAHWEVKRLKEYVQVIDGDRGNEYPNVKDFVLSGIPFLSSSNIVQNKLDFSNLRFISKEKFSRLRSGKLHKGDIVITVRGTIGATALFEDTTYPTAFINAQMMIIRPSCRRILPMFLWYITLSGVWEQQLDFSAYGTAQQQLNQGIVKSILVSLPPLDEQRAIAAYLDKKTAQIDRQIDLLTQKIETYGRLKQSLINETVTRGLDPAAPLKDSGVEWIGQIPAHWEMSRIKNFGLLSRGVDLARDNFVEGVYPVYGSNGIIGYHSTFTTKGPCITVGRSGSVGEVNYVAEDFWAHNTALYLQESFGNHIKFIFYLYKSLNLQSFSAGSAVGTLNRNVIHQLKIPAPSLAEQQAIAAYLDEKTAHINRIVQTIQTKIKTLQELRKTLINDVVTGKIKIIDN